MKDNTGVEPYPDRVVLAVTHVPGSTRACAARGDTATFALLRDYYALVAKATAASDGRVVKVMGDAVLLTFPVNRAADAVRALRSTQQKATSLWRRFDDQCHTQVKVGAGPVMCGMLGAPGQERFDIIGSALNALFKAPRGDFEIAPEVGALIEG